jgi:hypothetical protein
MQIRQLRWCFCHTIRIHNNISVELHVIFFLQKSRSQSNVVGMCLDEGLRKRMVLRSRT